jgi:hypothetical protein
MVIAEIGFMILHPKLGSKWEEELAAPLVRFPPPASPKCNRYDVRQVDVMPLGSKVVDVDVVVRKTPLC